MASRQLLQVQDGMTQISRQGTALIQFGKVEEGEDSGSVA
ncbi:hypothetical protein CTS44_04299 [Comamonas thiooxydans]|nr:hypothetical protein CTS44_04299 [Comamonas thiooxydans]